MGKKKKHAEEHENLERWLVSYADFITLLFATFVVLYALSQIDLAKFKDLKVSLRQAFSYAPTIFDGDAGVLKSGGDNILETGGYVDEQNMVPPILDALAAKEEEKNYELLQEQLKLEKIDEVKGVKTRVTERGLIIKLVGSIFYNSSESELKEESLLVIKRIGQILKQKFPFNVIRVEGHTDSIPINSQTYPSNWELSSARAASIVRYFIENTGIEKDRFVVVGYGDTRPVATNSTETGRNANRRVEIVVLRSKLVKSELLTYEFQKERLERLKKIDEMMRKEKQEKENLSDAALNLLDDDKRSKEQIILHDNTLTRDEEILKEKLKEYEDQKDPSVKKELFFRSVQDELRRD